MLKIIKLLVICHYETIPVLKLWHEPQLRNATAVPAVAGKGEAKCWGVWMSRIWGHSCRVLCYLKTQKHCPMFVADVRLKY